eukprot:8750959-Alexandrium_andersonii.AAC.1
MPKVRKTAVRLICCALGVALCLRPCCHPSAAPPARRRCRCRPAPRSRCRGRRCRGNPKGAAAK